MSSQPATGGVLRSNEMSFVELLPNVERILSLPVRKADDDVMALLWATRTKAKVMRSASTTSVTRPNGMNGRMAMVELGENERTGFKTPRSLLHTDGRGPSTSPE